MPGPSDPTDVATFVERSQKWVPITVVEDDEHGAYVFTGDERDGRPVVERSAEGTHRVLEFNELIAGGYRQEVPPPDENGDWPADVPAPDLPDTQLEPGTRSVGAACEGYTWIDNPRGGGGAYATDGPSTILLHMTVSMGLSAGYVSQHPYPPHCWANPYTGDKWQTVGLDRAAYALYQPASSRTWTNREGYTIQTELVGVPVVNQETYSDAQLHWIAENVVVPQARWLASVGRPVNLNQVAYRSDSSGSASEYWGGRLSEDEWENYNGLCQHSVIPYNDHWDCSVERLDLIAQYARDILGGGSGYEPLPPKPTYNLTELSMFILTGPGGAALCGAGYWKGLTAEEHSQVAGIPGIATFACGDNSRAFDVILSACMNGAGATDDNARPHPRVRMIECKGALWFTDFVHVYHAPSPEVVGHFVNLGWLDNERDGNGNLMAQGVPDTAFDALVQVG